MEDYKCIALVDGNLGLPDVLGKWTRPRGVGIESFFGLPDTMHALSLRTYPLILTTLRTAAGGYSSPEVRRVLYNPVGITFYMIGQIRQKSPNRETPIIVADIVDPSDDLIFPNAESRSLEAGANRYFSLFDVGGDELSREILRLIHH